MCVCVYVYAWRCSHSALANSLFFLQCKMREICISATVNLQKGMIGNRKIESLDACLGFFFSLSCSQASTFLLVSFFFFFPFVSSRRTQRNLVSEHYIIVTFRVSETAEELTRYAALVLACSTFHLRLSCSLSLDYLPFFCCLFVSPSCYGHFFCSLHHSA